MNRKERRAAASRDRAEAKAGRLDPNEWSIFGGSDEPYAKMMDAAKHHHDPEVRSSLAAIMDLHVKICRIAIMAPFEMSDEDVFDGTIKMIEADAIEIHWRIQDDRLDVLSYPKMDGKIIGPTLQEFLRRDNHNPGLARRGRQRPRDRI